jgi:hypothetical protein
VGGVCRQSAAYCSCCSAPKSAPADALPGPVGHSGAGQFGAVVAAQYGRVATHGGEAVEFIDEVVAGDRAVDQLAEALTAPRMPRQPSIGPSTWSSASPSAANGTSSACGPATGLRAREFWLQLLTEIKNRGVEDVCIVVRDGLKSSPD